MRHTLLVAGLAATAPVVAQQITMPAYSTTYTSTRTRAFWFQAPIGALVTGIQVYNEQNLANLWWWQAETPWFAPVRQEYVDKITNA